MRIADDFKKKTVAALTSIEGGAGAKNTGPLTELPAIPHSPPRPLESSNPGTLSPIIAKKTPNVAKAKGRQSQGAKGEGCGHPTAIPWQCRICWSPATLGFIGEANRHDQYQL